MTDAQAAQGEVMPSYRDLCRLPPVNIMDWTAPAKNPASGWIAEYLTRDQWYREGPECELSADNLAVLRMWRAMKCCDAKTMALESMGSARRVYCTSCKQGFMAPYPDKGK